MPHKNLRDLSLVKAKPTKNYDNKSNVPKDFWVIKDGGFVAINKSFTIFAGEMVKHKVTVKFGPYMSCGIVEHRTARLEGLQGKEKFDTTTFSL